MATLSQILAIAHQTHQTGRHAEAEGVCHRLLQQSPQDAEVWFQVGMTFHRFGNLTEAVTCYQRTLELQPQQVSAINNLGVALKRLGRLDEALQCYQQAIALNPKYFEAYNNLGNLRRQQGHLDEAIAAYKTCLSLNAEFGEAHHNLGHALRESGRFDEAIACYRHILADHPQDADALNNLGNALQGLGQYEDAIATYEAALQYDPRDPSIYNNWGAALDEVGQLEAAVSAYRKALALRPDYADAYYNLGNTLRNHDRLSESVVCYQKAIALKPRWAMAYNNLGLALHDLGQVSEAIAAYRQAIALAPSCADAHLNLGLSLLMTGDLQAGFAEYEWRWRVLGPNFKPPRAVAQPLWDGSNLAGKTILLHAEQGFGDTIQFIRYAPLVAQQGGRVLVECPAALRRLVQTCAGIDQVVEVGADLPDFQVHAPLMSLPHLLGTTVVSLPAQIPYLHPPASNLSRPDRPLGQIPAVQSGHGPTPTPGTDKPRCKVGVAWAGSPTHGNDRHRSCPFEAFQTLFEVESVQFYSLQKGDRTLDLKTLGDRADAVIDLSPHLHDFADTAAAIAQLDLVITVDTSVAHVAGAIGCPTWLLLSHAPDWRWMSDRDDSPWYPTLRLFRQTTPGDWQTVLQAAIAALSSFTPEVSHAVSPPPLSSSLRQTLALVEHQLNSGQLVEAEQHCRALVQPESTHPAVLKMLGLIAYRARRFDEARTWYQQAVTQVPDDPHLSISLGNACLRAGATAAAISHYSRAIAHLPQESSVYNNLGVALRRAGRYAEAIAYYRHAFAINPNAADAHYNLANALRDQGQLADAAHHYQTAVALQPDYADAWNNLANVLKDLNRLDEAIADYRHTLTLHPQHASAHHNLGYTLLLKGDLANGFAEYEWRWRVASFKAPRSCAQPLWDGSRLQGKTILLHIEQGFGDTLQFIRYATLVAQQGARVVVECQAPLVRLLQTVPGVDQAIARDQPLPDFHVHAPLLSLPHILGTTLDTLPASVPYVRPPEASAIRLDAPADRLKVGIAWAGSPTHKNDHNRSCPFVYFWSLLRTPGMRFYSLQKGDRTADIARFCDDHWPLEDLSDRLGDFADTAAAIAQLDLVITVDTAIAHLAGALGKPTWVLLPHAPDWRWMCDRDDSPWYPTIRLFRQSTPGDWMGVFDQVRQALSQVNPVPAASTALDLPLPAPPALGVGIELSTSTGWGVFGTHLVLHLVKNGLHPLPLLPPLVPSDFNPMHQVFLAPLFHAQRQFATELKQHLHRPVPLPFTVLKALGNHFVTVDALNPLQGRHTVGLIFFEDTHFTEADLSTARTYDRIIAGSSWNTQVLTDLGLSHVRTVCQGIDPTLFHPAPQSGLLGDRFVVFSGGKLEFRKGQDLVVRAFQAFQARHPEALLLTLWHNRWPATMADLEREGHVSGLPQVNAHGRLHIRDWLVANGIPASACLDVGAVPNHLVGPILREADVAIFPNRCEGGTNLAAMESLACGVPTLLSAHTGHLDLIRDAHCFPLRHQRPVRPTAHYQGTEDWGESDVEEILETLEWIYQNREQAHQRGLAAAEFMQDWTWDRQVTRFLEAIADFL